jgi:hypothetical protein
MTVWDSMALNAPHTEREIGSIHETGAGDLPTKLDGFPLLEEAIKEHFGQRCDEYMAGCPCCDTWAELDRLRAIRAAEARELAQEGEPATGSTTEPENATCPPAGGFGGAEREAVRIFRQSGAMIREAALLLGEAGNDLTQEKRAYDLFKSAAEFERDQCLSFMRTLAGKLAAGNEVMPDDETSLPHARPATSPGVTAGAVLSAIAAEKAEWPHAGSMHDGARMACNNIIRQLEARGE